jgi:hypothetical protein
MRFKELLAVSFRPLLLLGLQAWPLGLQACLDRSLDPECSQLDLLVPELTQPRKQGSLPRMALWGLQVAVLHLQVTQRPHQPMSILSAPAECK